jgi:hypothetical protein
MEGHEIARWVPRLGDPAQELPQPIAVHDLAHFVPATMLSVDFTRSAPTLPTHLS